VLIDFTPRKSIKSLSPPDGRFPPALPIRNQGNVSLPHRQS